MEFKTCNECHKHLPDTAEYFPKRLKKGGIWGTAAKCKRCYAERRVVKNLIDKARKDGYVIDKRGFVIETPK